MSELLLDCHLKKAERTLFERALGTVFEADIPSVLELLFVSEADIRTLNAEKRGVDAVTDVLSFPAIELRAGEKIFSHEHPECVEPILKKRKGEWVEDGARLYLGSVVICKKRAREQAEEYGHPYGREICYLTAHGLLHCLGYDHETEEEKRIMREKEEAVMRLLGLEREE